MSETRYTKDHEYIRIEGEVGTVGITDYAQHALGDVVFVELPELGARVARGAQAAVVESVKAAGWFFQLKIADAGELAELLDQSAYEAYLQTLE